MSVHEVVSDLLGVYGCMLQQYHEEQKQARLWPPVSSQKGKPEGHTFMSPLEVHAQLLICGFISRTQCLCSKAKYQPTAWLRCLDQDIIKVLGSVAWRCFWFSAVRGFLRPESLLQPQSLLVQDMNFLFVVPLVLTFSWVSQILACSMGWDLPGWQHPWERNLGVLVNTSSME